MEYPKRILSIEQQLQTYKDAGMIIESDEEVKKALTTIGYYRLRGYSYHLYNNSKKKYVQGTSFNSILDLYKFDTELSHLLFGLTSAIEVSLRAKFISALLIHNDALALNNPAHFSDKQLFWKNYSVLANEIVRSNDVFIEHNFNAHDGLIPVWAAVEVMSFGSLSKTIKNLKTGKGSSASELLKQYTYESSKGKRVIPSLQMMASWVQAVLTLRNMCAHNSRIYNRTISTHPQIIAQDSIANKTHRNGLYQIMLSMKYLRPSDSEWCAFVNDFNNLYSKYQSSVDLSRINFPPDWESHFQI